MLHMNESDIDELLSCDRYVNKRSQSVFKFIQKMYLQCC